MNVRVPVRASLRSPRSRPTRILVAAATLLLAAVAACSAPAGGSGGAVSDSDADAAAATKVSEERMITAYAGTDRALPSSSPPIVKDMNIWIIACGMAAEGCSAGANGAVEAGQAIGWKMTIVDGKFSVQTWNAGIRQAIAAKADGILIDNIGCAPIKGALQEAKAAGIKIYAWYALDCNDQDPNEPPLFDAEVNFGPDYANYKELCIKYGRTMADYIISKTQGRAKVIEFAHSELRNVFYINQGFEAAMAECKTCEIVARQEMTLADLGTTLQGKAATMLSRYPQANAVMTPYDSAVALGIGQAIAASGRGGQLIVGGGEGFAENVALVRKGISQTFYSGFPSVRVGWAAVDGMNRLLSGLPQADSGIGYQTADKDRNLPATDVAYDGNVQDGKPAVDYRANYLRIWGVS